MYILNDTRLQNISPTQQRIKIFYCGLKHILFIIPRSFKLLKNTLHLQSKLILTLLSDSHSL